MTTDYATDAIKRINHRYSLAGLNDGSLLGGDAPELAKMMGTTVEGLAQMRSTLIESYAESIGDNPTERELPWHLGFTGPEGADVTVLRPTMTVDEIMVAAKLDNWDLQKRPGEFQFGRPTRRFKGRRIDPRTGKWRQHYYIGRPPNERFPLEDGEIIPHVLGECWEDYQILNNEPLAATLNSLRATGADVPAETAGSLEGGRRTFISVKIGNTRYVAGNDPHELYLVLIADHTGAAASKVLITAVRQRCKNTVRLGEIHAEAKLAIHHRGDVETKLRDATDTILAAQGFMDSYAKDAERMAGITVNADDAIAMVEELFPTKAPREGRATTGARSARLNEDRRAKVVANYLNSPTLEGMEYNGFRFVQAVNEFSTFLDDIRRPEARLNRVWEPNGETVKRTKAARAMVLERK
jgi:phage/plasmid-like protein (TIGR03299 family)